MIAKNLIDAAGYARMSTDKQTESIGAQKTEILKLAAAQGFRIVKWYEDHGVSGADSDREDFQKLLADAEKGTAFRAILLWDQDRLTRADTIETASYWQRIRGAGVIIWTCRQGLLDLETIGGVVTALMNQHAKNEFLKSLSANVKRGKQRAREAGKHQGGPVLFGYRMGRTLPDSQGRTRLDSKPVPSEHAATIAEIFKRFRDGQAAYAIALELNLRKVPSPGKVMGNAPTGAWSARQVLATLGRSEYLGKYKVGVAVVACEPIVDPETFAAVQKRLAGRRKIASKRGGSYPLSGLVYCACCGSPMGGGTVGPKRHRYMRCGKKQNQPGTCHAPFVREDGLLAGLIAKLQESLLSDAAQAKLRACIAAELAKRDVAGGADKAALEKRLADLDKELAKASARMFKLPESVLPQAVAHVERLQAERDQAAAELAAAVPQSDPLARQAEVEKVMASLPLLRSKLDSKDAATLHGVLAALVERIEIETSAEPVGKRNRITVTGGRIHLTREASMVFAPFSQSQRFPSESRKARSGGIESARSALIAR